MTTFVIVGASLAGAKAAETLRTEGFDGRILLVGEDTDRPYERPPLTKGYLLGTDSRDTAFVHEMGWYGSASVELLLGVRATMLNPAAHTVTLDGFEEIDYDKVLLATGSRPRLIDVPGSDLVGVRYMRTLSDSDRLREALLPGASVVVIGGGWIGLETAAAAITHGATVDLVEPGTLPLHRVLGDEAASVFARLHQSHGVTFHFSSGVAAFEGLSGTLTGVRLTDGTLLPADVAIVGIGIVPNVELASVAGLDVDNGIVTDAAFRTSAADVLACGDVASSFNPLLGRHVRLDHWANALNSGPAAAKSMLGQEMSYDRVPYFYTDQFELSIEYAGWVAPGDYDRVVFRGDPASTYEFLTFWVKDGRVLAGMNANMSDAQEDLTTLVRAGLSGATVDLARLADPNVALTDLA